MMTAVADPRVRCVVEVPQHGPTDQQLMARLREQDIAALEEIYDRHHQVALGLACKVLRDRATAEDVVQDAFLTLWRQPERYDPAKGTPRGWLLAIVHHRSIDQIRRARISSRTVELSPNLVDEQQADPCDVASARIESGALLSALETLPDEQRKAIELAFIHGRTHVEIASLMGCPLGTVKGRVRIGLAKLRSSLAMSVPAVA